MRTRIREFSEFFFFCSVYTAASLVGILGDLGWGGIRDGKERKGIKGLRN
jgi:hypothetical protein